MNQYWSYIINFLTAWSFDPYLNCKEVKYLMILTILFINRRQRKEIEFYFVSAKAKSSEFDIVPFIVSSMMCLFGEDWSSSRPFLKWIRLFSKVQYKYTGEFEIIFICNFIVVIE